MDKPEEILRAAFNEYFHHWNIELPELGYLDEEDAGKITLAGWWITYRFGRDDLGRWLEFYAQHRMTNDRHVRFHESGEEEILSTLDEPVFIPEDATPEEESRISQAARDRYNRLFTELKNQGMV